MKFHSLLLLLLLSVISLKAQDIYDVDLIPSALKNRANAVIRNEENKVEMLNADQVIYTVKQAITVLNKNGERNARLTLFYDKNETIKSVKGEVYNEVGKLIGKFNQSNFSDESAVHDFSLFEDTRVKHYLPSMNNYPYTIVYNYEIRLKQNLIMPTWRPKPSQDIAVEKSSFTFICKPTDEIRIKTENFHGTADEKVDEKHKMLTWSVNNLYAVKTEPYSPNQKNYEISVKVAAKDFIYYNQKGTYTNWLELGKWYSESLLKNRQQLSPETIAKVRDLVKNEKDDKAKAKKIYEYVQDKTRYISVQVGIGGFQPFKAADVDKLGYGDCKALVNYMQSLLNAVDIESYYCVVNAGREKNSLDPTFAGMDQANHIILCMPLKGDTTWLECTNQKIPFGYLGDFTDDRNVLACTPAGGKLLKTPKYDEKQSLQIRKADLMFDDQGNLTGHVKTTFNGWQYENHEHIVGKPQTEQVKLLKEAYDIDNINFERISFAQQKKTAPVLDEELIVQVRNYGVINNNKLYFLPNAFNAERTIAETKTRILPLEIRRGYTDIDTISYQLAANILPLIIPYEKQITTKFGSYSIVAKLANEKFIYVRKFMLKDGTYPPSDYGDFSAFMNEVAVADKQKLVFNLKK